MLVHFGLWEPNSVYLDRVFSSHAATVDLEGKVDERREIVERLKPRLAVQREKINDVDNGKIKFPSIYSLRGPKNTPDDDLWVYYNTQGGEIPRIPSSNCQISAIAEFKVGPPLRGLPPSSSPLTSDEFRAMLPTRSFLRQFS